MWHPAYPSGLSIPKVPVNTTTPYSAMRTRSSLAASVALAALLIVPLAILARLSAAFPVLYGFGLIAALVGLGVLFVSLQARPSVIVGVLLIWFALQNFIAAVVAPAVPAWTVVTLILIKEVMYLLLFAVLVAIAARTLWLGRPRDAGATLSRQAALALRRMTAADALAIGFLALVGVAFLVGDASLSTRLVGARRLASLPLFYLMGRLLLARQDELRAAVSAVVWVGFAVALFGLVEWFILGDRFWIDVVRALEFQRVSIEGGIQPELQHASRGMPLNWSTFVVVWFRRLVSTFLEPTTLSIFLALALTLSPFALRLRPGPRFRLPIGLSGIRAQFARWPASSALVCGVIALAGVLTFGKGGAMIAVVAAVVALAGTTRRMAIRMVGAVTALTVVGLAIGSLIPGIDSNIRDHTLGLLTGVTQVIQHPLGSGLGSTGFWGENFAVGTDSTIGTIAGQLGLLGVVLWVGWVSSLCAPSSRSTDLVTSAARCRFDCARRWPGR